MLPKTDAAILAQCTKLSHALQRATGLTCYFIAKIGVFLAASSLLVDIANHYLKFLLAETPLWLAIAFSVMMLSMFLRTMMLSQAEDSIGNDTKPRALLFYAKEKAGWRMIYVSLACVDMTMFAAGLSRGHYRFAVLEWFDKAFFVGITIFYYFVAVDPLPPGKSKVKAWLEKFRVALKPATEMR